MTHAATETTSTTNGPQATAQTHTVGSGTASVTYDVHGDLTAATQDRPVLLMIASPMDAVGFTTLRSHFTDRPVVTYDPRGAGRNPTDTTSVTAEEHAEDVHRVIEDLGVGPVDVFASSGGAVNVLALVAAHPEDVRRVVAHEPPTAALLPDRETVLDVCRDMRATYDAHGSGPAMAKFVSFVMFEGTVPEDYLDRPAPDPAMFGLPGEDDGSRTDPLMRNMPDCTAYEPDLDALAVIGDRLVLAVGVESGQQLAARGGRSVAEALGLPVTEFPSDHGGFLGGEYGQHGDPDAFAAALHKVLD
jgi:pimeloyl-ACP methyl ester carboxylesterase